MPKAKYKDIVDNIKQQISSGRLACGARIESIREICDHYGVSSIVALRVFKELSEAGVVERRNGEGYFVSAPKTAVRGDKIVCMFRPLRDFNQGDNFGNRIIYGMMNEAFANHLHIVFLESAMCMRGRVPDERDVIRMAQELEGFRDAVGILVDMRIDDNMLLKHILPAARGIPIAVVGRRSNIPGVRSSELPHESAGRDAAHMARKCHAKYIFHFTDRSLPDSFLMTRAFTEGLHSGRYKLEEIKIFDGCDAASYENIHESFDVVIEAIHRHPGKVFIFASHDATAAILNNYINSKKDEPVQREDYSLFGFGGFSSVRSPDENFATFAVDTPALGAEAVRLVLENDSALAARKQIVPYKLVFCDNL